MLYAVSYVDVRQNVDTPPSDQLLQQLSEEGPRRPAILSVTLCVLKRPSRAAVRPVCTAIHLLARLAQHQPSPVQDESPPLMTRLCYLTPQRSVDMKRSAVINLRRCALMARHLSLSNSTQVMQIYIGVTHALQ